MEVVAVVVLDSVLSHSGQWGCSQESHVDWLVRGLTYRCLGQCEKTHSGILQVQELERAFSLL